MTNTSRSTKKQLRQRCEALEKIAHDLHWMARRYADGRRSYAPGLFNDHTRALLEMGVKLNPTGDGTVWANDGDIPFAGLDAEHFMPGHPVATGHVVALPEGTRLADELLSLLGLEKGCGIAAAVEAVAALKRKAGKP